MRRILPLLLLLAGCSKKKPETHSLGPGTLFALYGDSRTGDDVHREICASLLRSEAKLVITTGDLATDGEDVASWQRWREITKDLRAKMPYWGCKGDHDTGRSGHFEKELGLEKPYFEKEALGVHFFFLDSTSDFDNGAQVKWLEERAKASTAKHRIAVFHHPAFTIKEGREDRARRVSELIHGTLASLKFCAAFCGHDHHFYTTRRDGVRYVVTGGGGAPLYSLRPKLANKKDLYLPFHHFLLLSAHENAITAKVYAPPGKVPELEFWVCRHDAELDD